MNTKLIQETDQLLKKLFPICRSLTGSGARKTLHTLKKLCEFNIMDIPSGTQCYDWVVPNEWNITDGYIKDNTGKKIIDFKENNLHVINYSEPIDEIIHFSKLKKHLHTLPNMSKAIPYRTTYYKKDWGFCLTYDQFKKLDKNGTYHVFIDSSLKPGSLALGEGLIKGTSGKEFLFSTYYCHPSLANDHLSGIVLWILLYRYMKSRKTKHSYRFVILPETIGAIAYLSQNKKIMKKIKGGFVLTTVAGRQGKVGYKSTFLGNDIMDRIVFQTFKELNINFTQYPFDINGSDESQYSSPGFRIPIGTITKDKYFEYDYYHTSLDNLDFISAENLIKIFRIYVKVIENLEMNVTYNSLCPCGVPQFGKREDLNYPHIGGFQNQRVYDLKKEQRTLSNLNAMKWLMFCVDGKTSLLDISEKSNIPINRLYDTAEKLCVHKLLEVII